MMIFVAADDAEYLLHSHAAAEAGPLRPAPMPFLSIAHRTIRASTPISSLGVSSPILEHAQMLGRGSELMGMPLYI